MKFSIDTVTVNWCFSYFEQYEQCERKKLFCLFVCISRVAAVQLHCSLYEPNNNNLLYTSNSQAVIKEVMTTFYRRKTLLFINIIIHKMAAVIIDGVLFFTGDRTQILIFFTNIKSL